MNCIVEEALEKKGVTAWGIGETLIGLFFLFSLSRSLSLLLSVAGAELIVGSRPRSTPTETNTPDAHQGERHLSQKVTAGRRWIVVYNASVRVKLQLKISQVSFVNIVLIPVSSSTDPLDYLSRVNLCVKCEERNCSRVCGELESE